MSRHPSQSSAADDALPRLDGTVLPSPRPADEATVSCNIGSKSSAENLAQPAETHGVAAHSPEDCPVGTQHPLPATLSLTTPTALSHTPNTYAVTVPHAPKRYRSRPLQAGVDQLGNPLSKPWRSLWSHERLAMAFEAAEKIGGIAFTLNLSPRRQEFLVNRSDPADDLRRRISKALRSEFGRLLPFGFEFEVSPAGALHAHGVVIAGSRSAAVEDRLTRALAKAGGKIQGRSAARQVALDVLHDGLGWASYLQKAFDDACTHLGTHKVIFLSSDLVRLARQYHDERHV